MNRALAALLLAAAAVQVSAHETITTKLTWTRDIQRVFIKRCMNCHQVGGPAPFSLTSWQQVRPWAVAIREEVTARRMPPANAVKGFGDFRDDPALTQEEIQLITDWANGGAPEGDPRLESDELPRVWQAGKAQEGVRLLVKRSLRLHEGFRLNAMLTPDLTAGASLRAVLERPDGSLEPLAWVKDYRPEWRRPLVFREPVEAPAGSRVRVVGAEEAVVVLIGQAMAAGR